MRRRGTGLSHQSQELTDHALIKRQRRGQLDEDGASFLREALCLSQKGDKRFPRVNPVNPKMLAFCTNERGSWELCLIADMVDAPSTVVILSDRGTDNLHPSWSPDGRKLVFEGCRRSRSCDEPAIFVVRRSGGGLRQLAKQGDAPVWSPTGAWIAYHGKQAKSDECAGLVRVKPSGRGRRALLPRKPDSHDACSWGGAGADFAPDGKRLVYYGLHPGRVEEFPNPGGGTFKVQHYDPGMYTVGLDGSHRRIVRTRSLDDTEFFVIPFTWSPDGRSLLWRDERGTYVGDADGSSARRISRSGTQFAWQALARR